MLDDALAYVAQDSYDAAIQLIRLALEKAASLNVLSERGRVVPEFGTTNLRELIVERYRLIYEVDLYEVRIVAFVHCAREMNR